MHGIACWFDVLFDGSSVQRWLSTAPGQPTTHWYPFCAFNRHCATFSVPFNHHCATFWQEAKYTNIASAQSIAGLLLGTTCTGTYCSSDTLLCFQRSLTWRTACKLLTSYWDMTSTEGIFTQL